LTFITVKGFETIINGQLVKLIPAPTLNQWLQFGSEIPAIFGAVHFKVLPEHLAKLLRVSRVLPHLVTRLLVVEQKDDLVQRAIMCFIPSLGFGQWGSDTDLVETSGIVCFKHNLTHTYMHTMEDSTPVKKIPPV
jgi:hypothetical protein